MKMLVLFLVKGRLLDVTPMLGQDVIADFCLGYEHLLEQFAICQKEMGDKTSLSHAAAAGVSQR